MKELLVFGAKTFKITVPDDAKITFGPWSPPSEKARYSGNESALKGTLRVYENRKSDASILAVFSGVSGYRDTSIDYAEKTNIETGSVVWNSDKKGYYEEKRVTHDQEWDTNPDLLTSGEPDALTDWKDSLEKESEEE